MPVFTSSNGEHVSNGSLTLPEKARHTYVLTMLFILLLKHEDTRPFTYSRTFQSRHHSFITTGLDPWAALGSCWWLARKTQAAAQIGPMPTCTNTGQLQHAAKTAMACCISLPCCFTVSAAPTICFMQLSLDTQVAKMAYCKNWKELHLGKERMTSFFPFGTTK